MKKKIKSSYVAYLGIFTSLALILAFIESQIPTIVPIPGIKIGLPNIAIVIILYKLGFKEAISVNVIRVIIVSLLFGSALSFIYSLCGAICSTFIMFILKKLQKLSLITISVLGAVTHNICQIIVAIFVLDLLQLIYYLPVLLFSGTIAGVFVGLISGIVLKRIENFKDNN